MAMTERPEVREITGGKCWEHTFEKFFLKVYVPDNDLDGQVNNYGFRAPLLLVFEEEKQGMDTAVAFARETGLAKVAADNDTSVLFVYPTAEGGWAGAGEDFYPALIAEIKMIQVYRDGIVENYDFFAREFRGYFVRGAIFRADIYSFGKSADFAATHLLKTLQGEYLWGPGEITPAMVSMQGLRVTPVVERKDIAVISAGNSPETNKAFEGCEHLLVKAAAEYEKDYYGFVKQFKMWCGRIEYEPDFPALDMTEEAGSVVVNTSPDNISPFKDDPTHKVGYFAYYNNGLFDKDPVPLVLGFHGGGDSSMYLTFVAGWWEVAHDHDFLFVSVENHQNVTATEAVEIVEHLKKQYKIDANRIYATGFSMGAGKTWDCATQYPEVFAGIMPASALFPVYRSFFGGPVTTKINKDIPVPVFYSGGELSHVPELPRQADTALERITYVAEVNRLKKPFASVDFNKQETWENPLWGLNGEHKEEIPDPSRGSVLTIQYYDSEDGGCRTALASVSGQVHECRKHSIENAWKFISHFTR